jgi:hypothetical protein
MKSVIICSNIKSRICVENTCENMGFGQPLQGYLVTFFFFLHEPILCKWNNHTKLYNSTTTYFDPYEEAMS